MRRTVYPESEETETEPECALTNAQYADSISWKIGKVKAPPSAAKAKAGSGEMQKRLIVGFFFLSWYVAPMYFHPILVQIVSCHMALIIHSEAFTIKEKDFEEAATYRQARYLISIVLYYIMLPRFGILERSIIEASGFTAQENPIMFMVLYDYHIYICLGLFSLLFLLMVFSW